MASQSAKKILTSALEVERKFVPTALLKTHAAESTHKPSFALDFPGKSDIRDTFARQPRLRITDKYFDDPYRTLEKQGIWVRFRRSQPTSACGKGILAETKDQWEAKIKQGGDFIDTQSTEVTGQHATEEILDKAGIGDSIYDLVYQYGFVADRQAWIVKTLLETEGLREDVPEISVCLDTVTTALRGKDGDHPEHFYHQVGELELVKTVTSAATTSSTEHAALCRDEGEKLSSQLAAFMARRSDLFGGDGTPKGKLTAYLEAEKMQARRLWEMNRPGRIANITYFVYDRMTKEQLERV